MSPMLVASSPLACNVIGKRVSEALVLRSFLPFTSLWSAHTLTVTKEFSLVVADPQFKEFFDIHLAASKGETNGTSTH